MKQSLWFMALFGFMITFLMIAVESTGKVYIDYKQLITIFPIAILFIGFITFGKENSN